MSDWPGAMTNRVPVWLLDVDGVLNAVAREPDRSVWPDWKHGTAEADGMRWPIRFSPSVSRAIRRLHEHGLVEVRWLTTWRSDANRQLRQLLDLPAFDVVPDATPADASNPGPLLAVNAETASHGAATAAYRPTDGEWWKFAAARDVIAQMDGRPLIWTDDELLDQPDAVAWVADSVSDPLLIAPSPQAGLIPRHLEVIEDFCRRRAG
jgi:HAD domain in Swiss Army Knife RNA repair proteins